MVPRWRLTATNLGGSLVARGGRIGQRTVEGGEQSMEDDDDSAVAGHQPEIDRLDHPYEYDRERYICHDSIVLSRPPCGPWMHAHYYILFVHNHMLSI